MFTNDFVLHTLTPILAIIGAALGVFNLWLHWKSQRVSLKISLCPCEQVISNNLPQHLSMKFTIANHSSFPVSLAEIGLRAKTGRYTCKDFQIITKVDLQSDQLLDMPLRIESKSSVTGHFVLYLSSVTQHGHFFTDDSVETVLLLEHVTHLYAKLATSHIAFGGKKELPRFIYLAKGMFNMAQRYYVLTAVAAWPVPFAAKARPIFSFDAAEKWAGRILEANYYR